MAAGYDARIALAFAALGYDVFPFQAFDTSGNPTIPDSVSVPDHYKQTLGRIATAPIWSEIFRAISVLDDWGAYMAGLAFVGNDVRVAVFKSMDTVTDAAAAHQWSVSYHQIIEKTVSDYAGTSHLVDPAWVTLLNSFIGELPPSQKANDPKAGQGSADPGGKTPGGGTPIPSPSTVATPSQAGTMSFVPPWLLLGLRIIGSVLTNVSVRTYVRTTIFWFPGASQPPVDGPHAGAWTPLHQNYDDSRRRSVHGIWNWNWDREPKHIAFYSGPEFPWRGPSVPDMPHEPWQWCRAFYPTGNCGGPALAEGEGPLLVGTTVSSGHASSIDSPAE